MLLLLLKMYYDATNKSNYLLDVFEAPFNFRIKKRYPILIFKEKILIILKLIKIYLFESILKKRLS